MKLFLLLLLLFSIAPVYASSPALFPAAPDTTSWDFGTRSEADVAPVMHTFLLRNSTKALQTIDRVAVSCECVQVEIGVKQSLPVRVAPGQTVPVRVIVSLRRSVPGPITKSVWIFSQGRPSASVQLEVRGTLEEEKASGQAAGS